MNAFDQTHAVDQIVRAALKSTRAPGAAVAVVVGNAVYVQGYGAKALGKADPVTPDTLFAIASTTKAVTATTLALLVDENKAGWDDPVRKHLPQFRLADPLADAGVTLRDLLCHRTGLPRHDMLWLEAPWDRAEVLRRIGHAKPTAGLREKYQYQNIAFAAAGEAIARAAGAPSWEAFTKARLLDPLGMTRTNFSVTDAQADGDHATGHRDVKHKREAAPWRNLDNVCPCGGINSCARDLARWLQFLLAGGEAPGDSGGPRLLSEAVLNETFAPQIVVPIEEDTRTLYPDTVGMNYALGWTVWDYRGGHKIVSHGGSIGGFRSHVTLLPGRKAGVAVLSNMQGFLPEIVRNGVMDSLLGLPETNWNAAYAERLAKAEADEDCKRAEKAAKRFKNTRPSRSLNAYAGAYEEPAYGTATVTHENGRLTLAWSSFVRPLRHYHFDTFTTPRGGDSAFEEQSVHFSLGADGEVATLTLFDDVVFRRAKPAEKTVPAPNEPAPPALPDDPEHADAPEPKA